jgi:hypothetical protein
MGIVFTLRECMKGASVSNANGTISRGRAMEWGYIT